MTDYTKDATIDHERMLQWKMAAKLPYTLTKGVTATQAGLVFEDEGFYCYVAEIWSEKELLQAHTERHYGFDYPVMSWPDAAERLRYREGEPWATVSDRDDDMAIACGYGDPHEWGGIDAAYVLHRLAVIVADDAEAFRMLHWGVSNLQESGG